MGMCVSHPSKDTTEAIKELQCGKYAGVPDVASFGMFTRSVNPIE